MNNDTKLFMWFWACCTCVIFFIVSCICFHRYLTHQETKAALEAGYIQKVDPQRYELLWVKE